jgi:hypothetical protein
MAFLFFCFSSARTFAVRDEFMAQLVTGLNRAVFTDAPLPPPPSRPFQQPLLLKEFSGERLVLDNCRTGFAGGALDAPVFATLEMSTTAVTDVYLWMEHFSPELVAAQSGLLFLGGSKPVVVTAEARIGAGEAFSLFKGAAGTYGLIHVLSTLKNRLEFARLMGRRISCYRLALTSTQKRQLLVEVMQRSQEAAEYARYHTVMNNCILNLTEYLNRVLEPAKALRLLKIKGISLNPFVVIPTMTPRLLRSKGLIEAEVHLPRGCDRLQLD